MTTEPTTLTAPEPAADPSWTLQVVDIENAVKAIDYAAEQGAFKGWAAINEVLNIRNKLVLFLRTAQAEFSQQEATVVPSTEVEVAGEPVPTAGAAE